MLGYVNMGVASYLWRDKERKTYPEWMATEKYFNCEVLPEIIRRKGIFARVFKK